MQSSGLHYQVTMDPGMDLKPLKYLQVGPALIRGKYTFDTKIFKGYCRCRYMLLDKWWKLRVVDLFKFHVAVELG